MCEIGQQFTNTLGEIIYEIEQLDWYLFPAEVQRMLPTIITGVQKPIVVGCFGVCYSSREQFKKVSMQFSANIQRVLAIQIW